MSMAKNAYRRVLRALPDAVALQVEFYRAQGRLGNFRSPRTFSEKIQWRKLHEDPARFAEYADKVRVKDHVRGILGDRWIIPTVWAGRVLPPREARDWPIPFVIKANHASGWNYFVRSAADLDWPRIEAETASWVATDWHPHLREHLYNRIERQILVEPLLGDPRQSLIDYRFFCFSGRTQIIQVETNSTTDHRRCFYDLSWVKQDISLLFPLETRELAKPLHLDAMIDGAEALARDFDFVRVDLYDLPDHPRFSELTFLPGSGFKRFKPYSADQRIGELWSLPSRT